MSSNKFMKRRIAKYKIDFKTENEIIKKALDLTIKQEYEKETEANEIKRAVKILFPDVQISVLSISRYTKVRRLKR
jgi:hypothetical protein